MPKYQKALLLSSQGGPLEVQKTEMPSPGPEQLLVQIEAAALNPIDWEIQLGTYGVSIETYPAILGFDASGLVVEVGDALTGYSCDDLVLVQGWYVAADRSTHGTFQQFVAAPTNTICKIPANIQIPPDAAATVLSGLATAAFPLYNEADGSPSVKLLPPWEERGRGKYSGKSFFLLGGATSVGQYVIQLARMSGFSPIIVTASIHNAELLRSLGATHVLDRNLLEDELLSQVREIAGGDVEVVYDAVSIPDTLAVGYEVTALNGDFVRVLERDLIPRAGVPLKKRTHMAHGLFITPINRAVGASLLAKLPHLLETGEIKPNRPEVLPGGLHAVSGGLDRLRRNQVSGTKLVVRPQETA
ncbi:GroES-like protein [Trametes meyenii]|nr:GroES-like protein [Trametes meyenii]